MNLGEQEEFFARPFAEETIRLRQYDELAKCPTAIPPELAYYHFIFEKLLQR
jgi:predicted HD phosphohydrolase